MNVFTQEIYQQLVNLDVVRTTKVQHDVKLEGRSGQKHQIDVFWEYVVAGNKHRVAIECKNYNTLVPIGKVRDFKGVLDDLNGVNGLVSCVHNLTKCPFALALTIAGLTRWIPESNLGIVHTTLVVSFALLVLVVLMEGEEESCG